MDAVAAEVVAADGNGLARRHVQADGACPCALFCVGLLCRPACTKMGVHVMVQPFYRHCFTIDLRLQLL